MKLNLTILAASLLSASSAFAGDYWSPFMGTYEVTVTNVSSTQVLTPPAVIAHNGGYMMFEAGMPASAGLAHLAENGDPSMLIAEAQASSGVKTAMAGDLLLPGKSTMIRVRVPINAQFSVASMLAGTNDGFAAIDGVYAPLFSRMDYAMVYDAGSEENNEDCAFVPGPPCSPESGNARATMHAEGFVSVHNGVHGMKDLPTKTNDWRGPVAKVMIKRVK